MAKRWRPPFNFRRYCGDSASSLIHDLVCEKPACDVGAIPDENITMWDTASEVDAAVAAGPWRRCPHCVDTPLYFTPREDLRAVAKPKH
jgi:hypothetical protein